MGMETDRGDGDGEGMGMVSVKSDQEWIYSLRRAAPQQKMRDLQTETKQ